MSEEQDGGLVHTSEWRVWQNFLAASFLAVILAKAGIQNALPGVDKSFY
jgi:hypothetical protein